jgi:2-methylcitrate dehydratase PrpD
VELVPDEYLEKQYPMRESIVEVTFSDGKKETERVNAVRGTIDNPMTREEVVEKSRDLMTPVLGAAVCAKLIETVLNIENVKSIRDLRPLLQRQKEA